MWDVYLLVPEKVSVWDTQPKSFTIFGELFRSTVLNLFTQKFRLPVYGNSATGHANR